MLKFSYKFAPILTLTQIPRASFGLIEQTKMAPFVGRCRELPAVLLNKRSAQEKSSISNSISWQAHNIGESVIIKCKKDLRETLTG